MERNLVIDHSESIILDCDAEDITKRIKGLFCKSLSHAGMWEESADILQGGEGRDRLMLHNMLLGNAEHHNYYLRQRGIFQNGENPSLNDELRNEPESEPIQDHWMENSQDYDCQGISVFHQAMD